MKKTLLLTLALATFGFVQAQTNSITSGNMSVEEGTGYVFDFNGDAGSNCTSELANTGQIKESWNAQSTSVDTNGFANGQLILQVDTTEGWATTDAFTLIFSDDNCTSSKVDLSESSRLEIKINSTSSVPNFYIAFGDTSNSNISDKAIYTAELEPGDTTLVFEGIVWETWNNILVDSTQADYILMGFREGDWGTKVIPGTYTIDYIGVGNQTAVGMLDIFGKKKEFSVFPNPIEAGEEIVFPEAIENAGVFNMQGMKVSEFDRAKSLNTADMEEGVYFIQSDNGYSKFIVK